MTPGLHGEAWQVLVDCPHCRTEAAVVELMEPRHPAAHLGVPVELRCRLCTWEEVALEEAFVPQVPLGAGRCPACRARLDEAARTGLGPCPGCGYQPRRQQVQPPLDLTDPRDALRALERWAIEEGEADVDRFCQANMGVASAEVVANLVAGRPVATNLDVIAYLFPHASGGRNPVPPTEIPSRGFEVVDRPPLPAPELTVPRPQPPPDPRTPARFLASVMVADGEVRAGEQRFVAAFLHREGLPELEPADLRVWRPQELGPLDPALRERLVEAAVHLAHLDRERDSAEWKVIRAHASAWGVSAEALQDWDERYDRRYATALTRLWRSLSRMVRLH